MRLIGGVVGIAMALIFIACVVGLVVLVPVLVWMAPIPCALALLLAIYQGQRYRVSRRRRLSERAEMRALIAADRQRQAVKDAMVWGPIARGQTEEQRRYENLPDALA